jgi:aspartate aminotransferase
MTGWRVGWMVGPADAIKVAGNLQSHLSSNVNNVAQRAALAALTGPQTEAEQMRQAFDRRRKLIVAELAKIRGHRAEPARRVLRIDVTGSSARMGRRGTTSSLELADLILDAAEVAVPGEAFGPSGYLRLSYALGDDQLLEGPAPAAPVRLIAARPRAGASWPRNGCAESQRIRTAATAASDSAILRIWWMPRSARSG